MIIIYWIGFVIAWFLVFNSASNTGDPFLDRAGGTLGNILTATVVAALWPIALIYVIGVVVFSK